MEQPRFNEQLHCNAMERRNEEVHPGSQSVMQSYLDSMYANTYTSPSEHSSTSDVKSVQNYSIQTGEEFAFEFIRDRVNLKNPVFSNVGDSNSTFNGRELNDVLGISHSGFGNCSGVSVLSTVEKGSAEFNRQRTWLHGDQSKYGSARPTARTPLNQENGQFGRGYASYGGSKRRSSMMMKCLCSFGGRILPRPRDGKLRYVGGKTHLIRLRKDISWLELSQKAVFIYNLVHVLKYQLPGEELDALVSVTTDEDLQNMMEEYNLIEDREPPERLRIFLFSEDDWEDAQNALRSISNNSEVQYVVAINGIDLGSINNSTALGVSFSANDVSEFESKPIIRESSSVAVQAIGVRNTPLTNKSDTLLSTQSLQQVSTMSSNAFETGQLPNGDQMTQAAEFSYKHPVHQMTVDVRITPVTNKSDTSLATQSSQQVLITSSISHETDQHTNGGQMTHDAEICRQYPVQQMTVGVRNAPLTNKSDTSLVTQSSQQVLRTSSVAQVSRQYPVQQTTLDVWNTPLTNKSDTSLGTQSSQQILTMSSNAYETSPLTNGDQNTQTAETSRQYPVQQMTVGVRNAPLTNKSDTSLVTQSSQQVLRTSSIASETDQLTNGGQITQAAEVSRQYPVQQMALDVRNTPLTNNSDTLLATQSSQKVLRTSSIAHETGPLTSSDQMTSSIAHETGPQTNDDQMTQAAVVNCQCPVHQMTVGVRNTPLTNKSDTSLANQSSQQVLRTSSIAHETGPLTSGDQMTSSIAHETGPLTNGDQMMQAAEVSRQYPPVHQMTVGVRDAPSTNKSDTSLATQSSQQVLGSSSNAYETNSLTNGGQMTQAAEISRQYPVHLGLHPSHNPVVGETPISMAPHLLKNQPGILNKDYPPSGVHIQTSEVSSAQVKTIGDNNSGKQGSDQGNVLSLETPSPCLSVGVTMPEEHLPSFPSTQKVQHQDCEEGSLSSSSCVPNYVNSYSNAIDLTCLHPSPVPKRVYCSERTPREQVEVLNQSSKSDDTHSSHFHVSGLLSDIKPVGPVTESGDNLHDGNLLDAVKKPTISPTPFPADDHTVDNGFANDQMNKPLLDTNSEMKLNLSEHMDPELKHVLASNEGVKEVETKDNHIKPFCDETETKNGKSDLPAVHHVSSVERLDVIASSLPEIDWGEAYRKESNDSHVVQELPVSVAGNITEVVSQDFPANVTNQVEGDILIDIDDRFPREMLSDMYSKAILEEDPSILHPPSTDGIGYSVNMENHEPKSWSYFGKLAQEGLDNVSPIDKDHLGFSHHVTPQTTDRVPVDCENSHLNFGEENQDLHRRIETETHVLNSNYDQSQLSDTGSVQFDGRMENQRAPESEYEDGKYESKNCNRSPHDSSLGEIAINTVQVIKNDDLEELRELGSGTFGTVYHGKWRGTDVAIKRIKKSCFRGSISEQERLTLEFWQEADILSKLHHPNVVALYGVVQDGPGGTMATVTEFMVDGALKHVLLRKDKYLDHRKKLIIAMDAAFGMEYLHSKNIVHFDLKCDNLLVNLKDPLRPICKVGDFGLSKIKRNTLVTGGVRGTLPWMAPELLNGNSNKVSEKVDVFSFGIVLWEILTGEEPYANMHYGGIIGGIVNNTLRPAIPSYCDLEWKTLMEECWAPNPVARPSFTQIASRLRIMSAAATETKPQGNKPSK
ncbi:putative protein kinase TKL-Pl-6 family [Medicago truncatula]|uniref:Protein kinase domain-containing protein n=1 Tax=Medicago truncatula TaxID=3880 RepID=A0A396GPR9_MEDTR|nr:putative protein kinase TKL-Pl-6 family [Medicago truncatula]